MLDVDRLKERLAALDLSPNAASQKAGLGRDYVRDILRGRIKEPSALRLRRLSDVLQCSPEYLLGKEEGTWRFGDHPEPDDRDYSLKVELANSKTLLASEGSAFLSSFFNLMDSLNDAEFAELSQTTVRSLMGVEVRSRLSLTDAESRLLIGVDDEDDDDGSFERRAVLAKALGAISPQVYASAISLAAFWRHARKLSVEEVFSDEKAQYALEPLLRANGIGPNANKELRRLAIIGTVARFATVATTPNDESDEGSPPRPA